MPSLVLEYPDLLNATKVREGLLKELLGQPVRDAAAVHGAVGGAGLVVDLVERQGLRVHWKENNMFGRRIIFSQIVKSVPLRILIAEFTFSYRTR